MIKTLLKRIENINNKLDTSDKDTTFITEINIDEDNTTTKYYLKNNKTNNIIEVKDSATINKYTKNNTDTIIQVEIIDENGKTINLEEV